MSPDTVLRCASKPRQLAWLHAAALVEGTTLILLVGVAVPLKHLTHVVLAVRVMGPIHGFAFCAYLWTLIATISGDGWSRTEMDVLVAGAFIPFGGLISLRILRRRAATPGAQIVLAPP